jgi:hypothetical protein
VVETFIARRAATPAPDGYQIGDTRGELFKLRIGDRQRGATWHDEAANAVFLVAVDRHESRSEDDFYKWVPEAWRSGELRPRPSDYSELLVARDARWVDELRAACGDIGAEARALARRGESTEPHAVGAYVIRLAAYEVDETYFYAVSVDTTTDRPVDFVRAQTIARIIASELGVADADPKSIWEFCGSRIPPTSLAFDLS